MTYKAVLSATAGRDDVKGRRAYRKFVQAGIERDMTATYWKDVKSQVILGSGKFVTKIKEEFLKGKKKKGAGKKTFSNYGASLPAVKLQVVVKTVAKHFQVESDELPVRRSRHRQARRFLLGLCYDLMGGKKPLSEIGEKLGPVGAAALCRNRALLQAELNNNKKLSKKYLEILKEIKKNK